MIRRFFVTEQTGKIVEDGSLTQEERKELDKRLARMMVSMAFAVETEKEKEEKQEKPERVKKVI